jgi:hypothetical protein
MKITKATDIDKHKIVLDGCMITYTGIVFDLMNPNPDLIILEDIAHGLAFNSRWNGATKRLYTIAEHSIRVANHFSHDSKRQLTALFHDTEEAYWGDMIKPLKEIIKINSPEVLQKMKHLRFLIFDKFKIPHFDVSTEDWYELQWDFENLILNNNHIPMPPDMAEIKWLTEYRNLLTLKS